MFYPTIFHKYIYVLLSLDDNYMLKSTKDDHKGFIKHASGTMFIDEVQRAPAIIPEIKMAVDRNNRPGQYVLTGSANIQTLPIITDSMAGHNKHFTFSISGCTIISLPASLFYFFNAISVFLFAYFLS